MFVRGSPKKKSRWQSVLHLTHVTNSGNYTGAFNAIEKIKKGLSKHPQVAAVLKRQNEKLDKEDEPFVKDLVSQEKVLQLTVNSDLEKVDERRWTVDVSSAMRQCKTITEDATEMMVNYNHESRGQSSYMVDE